MQKKKYGKPEMSVSTFGCVIRTSGMNGVSETYDNDVGSNDIFEKWWQEGKQ